jgi:hypothetical protein
MKVVINNQYGGFGLSYKAVMRYAEIKGIADDSFWDDCEIERNDPALVQTVEELGDEANGEHATLKIIEIPDGIDFVIEEYDGNEWVSEKHKTWD